jgi:hypothetical protein
VIQTPAGRVIGHDGAIPGFLNIVLNSEDGRRQLGLMMNEEFATPAVSEAFNQALNTLAMRLLEGAPAGVASTSASLRAAVQAGESAPTAQALARARMAIQAHH